jgi:hypothetical protein
MQTMLIVVTLVSTAAAVAMSVVAWRLARNERRRSEARIAALAAEIGAEPLDEPLRPLFDNRPVVGVDMFTATPLDHHERSWTAATVGVLAVGSAVWAAVILGTGARSTSAADPHPRPPAAATTLAAPSPLELVALSHERSGDRLTVRGVVRRPDPAAPTSDITAVVSLFSHDGEFLGSGRTAVDVSGLAPGAETAFVVTIPSAATVGRYRVSFRDGDLTIPHLDMRS